MSTNSQRISIDVVNHQVRRFSGVSLRWPEFPRPLEERFERDTEVRRSKRLWLEG